MIRAATTTEFEPDTAVDEAETGPEFEIVDDWFEKLFRFLDRLVKLPAPPYGA